MIVTCPNCTTRYNLPDDKVPPGGAKVKCSKCAHVFKAGLPPASPEEEVESLLENDSPAPEAGAGDDFDATFDEVAAGQSPAGDEEIPQSTDSDEDQADDAAAEDELGGLPDDMFEEDTPEPEADAVEEAMGAVEEEFGPETTESDASDDMPGVDDLFDDVDDRPEPEEGPAPTGIDEEAAENVDSLFGDDDELFDDDESEDAFDDELGEESEDVSDDLEDDESDLFLKKPTSDEDLDSSLADEKEEDEPILPGETDFELDKQFDEKPEKKKSSKSMGCLIILVVTLLCLGGGVYWAMTSMDIGQYLKNVPYVGKMFMEETGGDEPAAPGESPEDRVRNIELKNVRQYYVANEKTGNLFIVDGKAVNKFSEPKERIKVEVVLYDASGNVLTSQAFLCGNVLSQFQLQVQTRKEIEEGLASDVGILSNNMFLRPGSSTPFMAVFFDPPGNVKEFLVKVVDVSDPE
ncbi:MAG: hypothetical protein CL942_12530 [Desulfovibrio sp.]|nr:hypothetical protein [Desulfovibrio sp.]|tara:strand:+ start:992 stop:2383 length:1392 start_codon:yes stop_codon:yes gene_type:complete